MTSELDRDALFSLELIVDRLVLSKNVTCRFPAVAFRLLDFPTLIIDHVEPPFAEMLRTKILADRHAVIPAQFQEMLDRHGAGFLIRRGKSCLFRLSPNAMKTHLSLAPLYVMVVDTFPEVPKFVGSCTVALDKCMSRLYEEISALGVSVPSVSSENCELGIMNLMGDKLGTISFGLRLLSLGSALLAHIPDQAVAATAAPSSGVQEKREHTCPVVESTPETEATSMDRPAAANIESEMAALFRSQQQVMKKSFADGQSQVERSASETVATQTIKRTSQKCRLNSQPVDKISDDIVSTNVLCPPPLFYHARKSTTGVRYHVRQDWSVAWQYEDESGADRWSNDGTIRPVDKCTDSDDDIEDISWAPSALHEAPSFVQRSKRQNKTDPTAKTASSDLSKFPLLNALLAEILRLQGMNLVPIPNSETENRKYTVQRRKTKATDRGRELSSTKPAASDRQPHRCFEFVAPIPKDVSWLGKRTTNIVTVHNTLIPGMTHTQKLRLSKSNPGLLQELEIREAQRRSEFMATRDGSKLKKLKSAAKSIDDDRRKNASAAGATVPRGVFNIAADIQNGYTAFDDRLGESLDSRENTARHKRPVPTPRTSKLSSNNKENERFSAGVGSTHGSHFDGTKTYSVLPRKTEPPLSLRSSSEEKIQLSMPTFDEEPEDEGSPTKTTAKRSVGGRKTQFSNSHQRGSQMGVGALGSTRVLSAPSMPKEAPNAAMAGDDAEDMLLTIDSLGLKRYIEQYPDDDGDEAADSKSDDDDEDDDGEEEEEEEVSLHDVQTANGKPPQKNALEIASEDFGDSLEGLKKIVDRYSNDSDGDSDEEELERSLTVSHSARSYSSVDDNRLSSGRSSASPHPRGQAAGSTKRNDAVRGSSAQLARLRPTQSPRKVVKTGDRQLELDIEASNSLGVESYSEIFEEASDDELRELRSAREARPVAEAKLGYTWT